MKVEVVIKLSRSSFVLSSCFSDDKKIIERTKLLFSGSSVNDNNDVFVLVSFISIAILFLVIAFSQINLCQTSSMQEGK